MRKISVFAFVLFSLVSYLSVGQKPVAGLARPKLVVGIVVDQMRWDYIYRYYDRYQANGFRRFLSEGFTCENTYIDYVPTVTAIGHSTVYTGSIPAIHGIAGNDFFDEATGKSMYCAGDSTVQTVGSTSDAGKMSPRNLLVSTITDELKLATNFRSKVIGIALKDRGGILPAGHTADAAYWFDDVSGNWITSTYYMKELPAWLVQFNGRKLPEKYLKQDWNTLYDIRTYVQSATANAKYEGVYGKGGLSSFPIKTSDMINPKDWDIIRSTPYGNTITLDLAKAIVDNEQMGKHAVTDFLTVSCSSTDYVGHKMGVNAIETEDTYLRLDRDLAAFFTYLDTKVGKGNYTVFLTADHGAAHNPNFLTDHNVPAGFFEGGPVQQELNSMLEKKYNTKNLVISLTNSQVHINNKAIAAGSLNEEAIRKDIVTLLRTKPHVSFVIDNLNPDESGAPEIVKTRVRNGFNFKRSGIITFVLDPGWYAGSPKPGTGTTHGSWNSYDAHIPLLWMGWGVRHGVTNRHTGMTDISATLAALLHIQEPNGCVGHPIEEVIKK